MTEPFARVLCQPAWKTDQLPDQTPTPVHTQDYVPDVQRHFKDKQIVIDNCKKDSNELPIFEAKGVLYPACR
jgi:hypothetical protein